MTSVEQLCYLHQLLYKQCLRKSDHVPCLDDFPSQLIPPDLVRATATSYLLILVYHGLVSLLSGVPPFPQAPMETTLWMPIGTLPHPTRSIE